MPVRKMLLPLLSAALLAAGSGTVLAAVDAKALVEKAEERLRGNSVYARFTMKIDRRRIKRTLQMDSWDDSAKDKFFIRILQPRKDRGVTFLKAGNNLYQYIPRIGREMKIEGSLMQASWMGSDFNNDDLMKRTSVIDDYDHTLVKSEGTIHTIKMVPRPTAAVVWKHVIVELGEDGIYRSASYYNHRGEMAKQLTYSDIKPMGGRTIPTVMQMATYTGGQVSSTTTIIYERASFNQAIPAAIFSRANLRKRY